MHLGDTLHFKVDGEPVAGELTMTISSGAATPLVQHIPFRELGSYALVVDAAHLALLSGAELQRISISLSYRSQPGGQNQETHDIRVLKDTRARPEPPMRVQGPGTLAEYHPRAGETAADAFVRDIGTTDWQGTGLSITSHASTLADMHPKGNYGIDLAPTTPVRVYEVRVYEVRGTFPLFVVPAMTSTTNADVVMAPSYLEVGVTETVPIRVVSLKAFPG